MEVKDSHSEIVFYEGDNGTPQLQVRLEDDTVWLSQQQMAELFQTTKQNISQHIKTCLKKGS